MKPSRDDVGQWLVLYGEVMRLDPASSVQLGSQIIEEAVSFAKALLRAMDVVEADADLIVALKVRLGSVTITPLINRAHERREEVLRRYEEDK